MSKGYPSSPNPFILPQLVLLPQKPGSEKYEGEWMFDMGDVNY